MKYSIALLVSVIASLAGCATVIGTETSYVPWQGEKVFKGKGGGVEVVNSFEFWTHGEPEKPYKIIGLITQKRSDDALDTYLFGNFNRQQIVDLVKREGGDGVVTVKRARFSSQGDPHQESVLAVFRYEKPLSPK